MVSSWMLRLVVLVRTDVSEEPSASFIRATRRNITEDTILQRIQVFVHWCILKDTRIDSLSSMSTSRSPLLFVEPEGSLTC
jgi:hypothetical protein